MIEQFANIENNIHTHYKHVTFIQMRLIDIVDLHTGLTFDVEDHELIQSVNNGMTPDIKWLNYNNVHIPIVNLRTMQSRYARIMAGRICLSLVR